MILDDNLNILKQRFPFLYEQVKAYQCSNSDINTDMIDAKSGVPTLYYKVSESQIFIHSKYNPVDEAAKLVEKYSDINRYKHVFFFGIGLGYHIEIFGDKYPDVAVSLYEPDKEIFNKFISIKSLNGLLKRRIVNIYTGAESEEIREAVSHFANKINGEVLFIALPSYERIFADEYRAFLEAFHMALKDKRASLQAQTHFQKLWTTNSIRNFKEVLNSSNILQEKRCCFEGKPAILAAAGPSLEEELENLRSIKEKGQAYIFSVGSAINTLLANEILPDAVCIYDPGANTNEVIRKLKERKLRIPLIYGSSVYSGAVEDYPGCRLHMLTSQDTISAYFLKNRDGRELAKVIDAPSVAIVTLQMLVMLGCDPIILVGQNFAYRNNRFYAQGVEYKSRPGELYDVDINNAVETEDVHGGTVQTSQLLNHMRNQMEMYIELSECGNIINTTKGGAKIKGTEYKPLKQLIEKELSSDNADNLWFSAYDSYYDIDFLIKQGKLLIKEREKAEELISELIDTMSVLGSEAETKTFQKALSRFECAYNTLVCNEFFNHILKPMNRVQFEMIVKNIEDITILKDIKSKARFISDVFADVFECCKKDMKSIKYDFEDMIEEVLENDIKVMSFTIKTS